MSGVTGSRTSTPEERLAALREFYYGPDEGVQELVRELADELAASRALNEQMRDALDAIKGNVYLYRIEHLTPDTLARGVEDAIAKAERALAEAAPAREDTT